MNWLTGRTRNTLDDKGRVSLPSRLREKLPGTVLWLTQGKDNDCLQLMTPEEWEKYAQVLAGSPADNLAESLVESSTRTAERRTDLTYRIISPAHDVEIDRVGRISIPPDLRDFAGLALGEECLVVGMGQYIELWNIARFEAFEARRAHKNNTAAPAE